MLVPLLMCVAMATVTRAHSNAQRKDVLTFNAYLFEGATGAISNDERRTAIIDGLLDVDADAVCLQEVWIAEDVEAIADGLSDVYGHVFSQLHQTGELPTSGAPTPAACPTQPFLLFLNCAQAHTCISMQPGTLNFLTVATCVFQFCLTEFMLLPQKCVSCVIYSGSNADLREVCMGAPAVGRTNTNGPGLVLLSKYPMTSTTYTDYHTGFTQLIVRGYLNANIEGMGAVTCTHITVQFPFYMEVHLSFGGQFSSYAEQAKNEVGQLLDFVAATSESHIALGDFNTGPEVGECNISGHAPVLYDMLTGSLNTTLTCGCTYCALNAYNTVGSSGVSKAIDHVFVKNHEKLRVEVVLDDHVVPSSGLPLSDHYGVLGNIRKLKQTAGLPRHTSHRHL